MGDLFLYLRRTVNARVNDPVNTGVNAANAVNALIAPLNAVNNPVNAGVNAGFPQGSILAPTPFLLYINDLPGNVICNITVYADNTT